MHTSALWNAVAKPGGPALVLFAPDADLTADLRYGRPGAENVNATIGGNPGTFVKDMTARGVPRVTSVFLGSGMNAREKAACLADLFRLDLLSETAIIVADHTSHPRWPGMSAAYMAEAFMRMLRVRYPEMAGICMQSESGFASLHSTQNLPATRAPSHQRITE